MSYQFQKYMCNAKKIDRTYSVIPYNIVGPINSFRISHVCTFMNELEELSGTSNVIQVNSDLPFSIREILQSLKFEEFHLRSSYLRDV